MPGHQQKGAPPLGVAVFPSVQARSPTWDRCILITGRYIRVMKNPHVRCPAIVTRLWCQIAKRLWCQLAISYTFLTFGAMMLLITLLYTLDDYNDFRAATDRANIERLVDGERRGVAQAVAGTGTRESLDRARDAIRDKLLNIEQGSGSTIYRITNSSRPVIRIQVVDAHGRSLLDDGVTRIPSDRVGGDMEALIVVDTALTGDRGENLGRLRVLYAAEFDMLIQLRSLSGFLSHIWTSVFFCSVPIGIACGLMASRYVTRQLQDMNAVTERWRQGDFSVRIALPNDDVLIRHSQHLNEMAQDLEMYLNLKQERAVSSERNRVARELHDTVKQKLFALGLQLATAKSKPNVMEAAREHVLEAETITREAQHDLMEIITQLHPQETCASDLPARIAAIADDFRRRFGVGMNLNLTSSPQLDAAAQHQVLRIVQEAVMNAIRHGKASRIEIASQVAGGLTRVTIADNGVGFGIAEKGGGFGIASMRARAGDLPGGTLDITSAEGIGTQVVLSWKGEA